MDLQGDPKIEYKPTASIALAQRIPQVYPVEA